MIEKNFNKALIKKEPSAVGLVKNIFELESEGILNLGQAALYHQFPFYREESGDNIIKVNILLASNVYGIVIFQAINSLNELTPNILEEIEGNLNSIDSIIFSKLIKQSSLQKDRRNLKINISIALFIQQQPTKTDLILSDDIVVVSTKREIAQLIEDNARNAVGLTDNEFNALKAVLEGSKGIIKPVERALKTKNKNSKGAILSKIESEIYNFDSEQKQASFFTLDGPQRIRGLAGSGKTVILALKVALIHLQNPEANVLYTYYTKSLYDLVKRLITRFYRQYSDTDPN